MYDCITLTTSRILILGVSLAIRVYVKRKNPTIVDWYFLKYFSNLLTNKSVCQVQWVDLLVFVENGILEQLTKLASETHTREQKHILER